MLNAGDERKPRSNYSAQVRRPVTIPAPTNRCTFRPPIAAIFKLRFAYDTRSQTVRRNRLQFSIRTLLVVLLAFSCYFGGWTSHDRMARKQARVQSAMVKRLKDEYDICADRIRTLEDRVVHAEKAHLEIHIELMRERGETGWPETDAVPGRALSN